MKPRSAAHAFGPRLATARRSVVWRHGAARAAPSYLYLFAHAPDGPSGRYPALAHHASEIPFVFQDRAAAGPSAELYHISQKELTLSDAIVREWRAFAASGAPSRRGAAAEAPLGKWPPFAPDENWMVFGGVGGVASLSSGLKHAACDLWDEVARYAPARRFRPRPHVAWSR